MISDKIKIGAGYTLICIIWGSTWLAIRIGLDSLSPIISGGLRFLFASLFIFILTKINGIKLQKDPGSIRLYWITGFFSFVVPFGLVYWAEQFIPSGLASIVFAVMPFGVILFTWFFLRETKISMNQVTGVVLGFAGIVIIFSDSLTFDFSNYFLGILAVLLSATMQAGIAVLIKKEGQHLHPLSMNLVPLIIAGIVMTVWGLIFENPSTWNFNIKSVGSIIYLAFFGTVVTFSTYYWLLKRINIVVLSLTSFITPIVAVMLGWIVLNEKLSFQAIIGSSLVLIGILFANFRQLKKFYYSKMKNSIA